MIGLRKKRGRMCMCVQAHVLELEKMEKRMGGKGKKRRGMEKKGKLGRERKDKRVKKERRDYQFRLPPAPPKSLSTFYQYQKLV